MSSTSHSTSVDGFYNISRLSTNGLTLEALVSSSASPDHSTEYSVDWESILEKRPTAAAAFIDLFTSALGEDPRT
jgi:hypothetical protein